MNPPRALTFGISFLLLLGISNSHGSSRCYAADRPRATSPAPATLPAPLSDDERQRIEHNLEVLHVKLTLLRANAADPRASDRIADAEALRKAVVWALRYETQFTAADVRLLKKDTERCQERLDALAAGNTPWANRKGKLLRGYISAVDGSCQPYGVIIPGSYDAAKPMRLDVVLHGSSKPTGLSEARFIARFDEGDGEAKSVPTANFIELHPLGRVENCYRWAGETDVFEAIEAVCQNYNIDRDRIVLRGMSMGASGTWHLGLKHPSSFVAIAPYCGYVDTHRFSQTPHFIRVDALPWHQEKTLHMLDSVDYAANAGVVPEIAAIGDKDPFWNYSHVIMEEVMAREGLKMVNLISPGTGHMIDPVTFKKQMRQVAEYADKGLDHAPRKIRFVTWTLKYNVCHWIELLALKEHYERAEIAASLLDDGSIEIAELKNITRFAIHPPMSKPPITKIRIGGVEVLMPAPSQKGEPAVMEFVLEDGKWRVASPSDSASQTGKRPGVQGPIDDAFTTPFLCVRGTGKPWNPAVAAWADASLRRFEYEFAKYMRGEVQVKNDTEVTEQDVKTKNLILFGDPGSNSWIRKALPGLPITWGDEQLTVGTEHYLANDHAPALICASPFPGAGNHYVVINSGHTFHEKEFAAYNYLLFPRLGDWAVMKIGADAEKWKPSSASFPEEPVQAGFFDEQWKKPVAGPR